MGEAAEPGYRGKGIGGGRLCRDLSPGGRGMSLLLRVLAAIFAISILVPECGSVPGIAKAPDADIIVTAAPGYRPLAALRGEERFPGGAQLLLIHEGKAAPLVNGFAATADANVSFD